jgi:hypothetical protein
MGIGSGLYLKLHRDCDRIMPTISCNMVPKDLYYRVIENSLNNIRMLSSNSVFGNL